MYRLKSGKLWRGEVCIRPGEAFEPSEAELLAFGDLMEAVEDLSPSPFPNLRVKHRGQEGKGSINEPVVIDSDAVTQDAAGEQAENGESGKRDTRKRSTGKRNYQH